MLRAIGSAVLLAQVAPSMGESDMSPRAGERVVAALAATITWTD